MSKVNSTLELGKQYLYTKKVWREKKPFCEYGGGKICHYLIVKFIVFAKILIASSFVFQKLDVNLFIKKPRSTPY